MKSRENNWSNESWRIRIGSGIIRVNKTKNENKVKCVYAIAEAAFE